MVLVFGVDVPLVELTLAISTMMLILMVEITVVMIILFYQLRRSKEVTDRLERVAQMLMYVSLREMKKQQQLKTNGTNGNSNGHTNGSNDNGKQVVQNIQADSGYRRP